MSYYNGTGRTTQELADAEYHNMQADREESEPVAEEAPDLGSLFPDGVNLAEPTPELSPFANQDPPPATDPDAYDPTNGIDDSAWGEYDGPGPDAAPSEREIEASDLEAAS